MRFVCPFEPRNSKTKQYWLIFYQHYLACYFPSWFGPLCYFLFVQGGSRLDLLSASNQVVDQACSLITSWPRPAVCLVSAWDKEIGPFPPYLWITLHSQLSLQAAPQENSLLSLIPVGWQFNSSQKHYQTIDACLWASDLISKTCLNFRYNLML